MYNGSVEFTLMHNIARQEQTYARSFPSLFDDKILRCSVHPCRCLPSCTHFSPAQRKCQMKLLLTLAALILNALYTRVVAR